MLISSQFADRTSIEAVEEGMLLAPKFDANGLIPAIATDAATDKAELQIVRGEP